MRYTPDERALVSFVREMDGGAARALRALSPATTCARIRAASEAAEHLQPLVAGHEDEHIAALFLSYRHHVIAAEVLTKGCPTHTIVDTYQVARQAMRHEARAVVLAHNHPSGDMEPSSDDIATTKKLRKALLLLGVNLADHLVFGGAGYTSMASLGYLGPE